MIKDRKILIIDDQGIDQHPISEDLMKYVEFYENIHNIKTIDLTKYLFAIVHQSNRVEYNWVKDKISPAIIISGAFDDIYTPNKYKTIFIPRDKYKKNINYFISTYITQSIVDPLIFYL